MPNPFLPAVRMTAGALIALAAIVPVSNAVAGSIVVASRAGQSDDAAPPARSSFTSPGAASTKAAPSAEACAIAYHPLLQKIAANELATLRALKPAAGAADPSLPGRLLIAEPMRLAGPHAGVAAAAANLAANQGRSVVPQSANARWIASRIQEDLTDYLRQGPSPFLCSGVANYLSTLRSFATQLGGSAQGRDADIALAKETATALIHAAHASLHVTPVPSPSPETEDGPELISEVSMRPAEAAPIRVAGRSSGALTASDASARSHAELGAPLPLATPADLLVAIDGLLDLARGSALIAPESVEANATAREREEAAMKNGRPVLARLARSGPTVATIADVQTRSAFLGALASIETLDYLIADADGASDPVGSALAATMTAIEAAHAEACACGN